MTPWPFRPQTPPIAIAHRGGNEGGAENTIEAFAAAVAAGYRYVETDVHLTADGEVVAFHDADLARLAGRDGRIAAMNWRELAGLRIRGGGRIPRLAEILTAWPELFLNIDPKSDAVVQPLIALLRHHDAVERVCVGSFSSARLRTLRHAFGSALATSMGPVEILRLRLASLGLAPAPVGAVCAQVPMRQYGLPVVDARFVACAHRLGLKVHVWTINDRPCMEHLLDLGVDGIMTDDLSLLKTVFRERGLWPAADRG